jgi:hypothetical protein
MSAEPTLECTKHDPEIWVAHTRASNGYAKQLCRRCPELIACQNGAIKNPDPHMILGGMTPEEQRLANRHHTKRGTIHSLTTRKTA